jgi:hypothetical protein
VLLSAAIPRDYFDPKYKEQIVMRPDLLRQFSYWTTAFYSVVVIALLGVSPQTAVGQSGSGERSRIHACINNVNGNVRIVDGASSCRENEHSVHWNVAGPQGPQGEQGPQGAGGGSHGVVVRWGSGTAPSGTTLVYSGLAFSGHWSHSGSGTPLCVVAGDAGLATDSVNGDLLYPVGTFGVTPPGIQPNRLLKCAVALAEGPTAVAWGTSQAPSGWQVLYSGYSFGADYTMANPLGRVCIDSVDFDSTLALGGTEGLYFATRLQSSPVGVIGYTPHTFVPCAVVVKTAAP